VRRRSKLIRQSRGAGHRRSCNRLRCALRVSSIAVPFLVGPLEASGQRIEGRLVDAVSERGIPAGTISLLSPDGTAQAQVESDSSGAFVLPLPRSGELQLSAEALGYRSLATATLRIAPSEVVEVVITLSVDALEIRPLVVTARRAVARPLRDWERRRSIGVRTGRGVFLTREDLDRAFNVSTPLVSVPGLPRSYDRRGGLHVGSRTCPGAVFLNGMLVGNPALDEFIYPTDLEGIEVYRRTSELPVELRSQIGGVSLCSAVVLWTRQGQVTEGGSWFRWGLVGALVGGFVLLFVGG
jgi:hypothetical protein